MQMKDDIEKAIVGKRIAFTCKDCGERDDRADQHECVTTPKEIVELLGNVANRPDIAAIQVAQIELIKQYGERIRRNTILECLRQLEQNRHRYGSGIEFAALLQRYFLEKGK